MKTIKDIAKLAGVSVSAVSLVLNNKDGVSEETRQRVLEIAEKYNYKLNNVARQLVTKKSNCIGVIFPYLSVDEQSEFKPNYYVSEVITGIERIVQKSGFNLMVAGCEGKGTDIPDIVENKQIDGICLVGGIFEDSFINALKSKQIPIVSVGSLIEGVDSVVADDKEGAFQATNYLIKNNHEKIAFINGSSRSRSSIRKLKGFIEAFENSSLTYDEKLIISGDFSIKSGHDAVQKLLAMDDTLTAIFVADDAMALGVIQFLRKQGYVVPDDISVIGYGDYDLSKYFDPPLTTVRVPKEKMGEIAIKRLIEIIETKPTEYLQVTVSTQLVPRESVVSTKGVRKI